MSFLFKKNLGGTKVLSKFLFDPKGFLVQHSVEVRRQYSLTESHGHGLANLDCFELQRHCFHQRNGQT